MKIFKEFVNLGLENPVSNIKKPFDEAAYNDLKLNKVNAIYPVMRAITTGKRTRNNTFYSAETMLFEGNNPENPLGFKSFIYPYQRPVITEHRLSDSAKGIKGDEPIGRVVASYWKGHTSEKAPGLDPGFVSGDGALYLVPAITNKEAIEKITTGIYHTLSIGSRCGSVIESVTGCDILNPGEKELPDWMPGSIVKDKQGNEQLSYLKMFELEGREISFVNAPSDTHAQITDRNLGEKGIRLLTGHKTKEGIKFYDISTRQEVFVENCNADVETFQNSVDTTEDKACALEAWLEKVTQNKASESLVKINDFVEFQGLFNTLEGKIVNIYPEGIIKFNMISLESTSSNPVARIRVYKNGKATNTFVNKNVALLLQKDK
jgi:hypothetical protein